MNQCTHKNVDKISSFQTKTPAEKLQNSSFDMTVLSQVWMRQEVYRKTCSFTRDTYMLIEWLIIYCFTSRSRIWFHLYGDITIAGEGLQNLELFSALWAGRDLCHATHAVTWGLCFSGLIQRTAPFSRLLQHMGGCGGCNISNPDPQGPHSVSFYDTQLRGCGGPI
jgi:hypothetical protein